LFKHYFKQAVLQGTGVGKPGIAATLLDEQAAEPMRRITTTSDDRHRVFI